jgi:hypothetical protein
MAAWQRSFGTGIGNGDVIQHATGPVSDSGAGIRCPYTAIARAPAPALRYGAGRASGLPAALV